MHEQTSVVEVFVVVRDLRHSSLVLLRVQLGVYFSTKLVKNRIKIGLHMMVHKCAIRHVIHMIQRASHTVIVYMASIYNTKAASTSSLQQDTLEHMMSYTYLPLQLLPARTHSNIQIYTLHIPKSGKTAAHRARHQGTYVPRDVGAGSPPHGALEPHAEAQARTESGAAPQGWEPAGKVRTRGHRHQGWGPGFRFVSPTWKMLECPKS